MKKKILIILMLTLTFFIRINSVYAESSKEFNETEIKDYLDKNNKENYEIMCGYNITRSNKSNEDIIFPTAIVYNKTTKEIAVVQAKANNKTFKFSGFGSTAYISEESRVNIIDNGICPTYAYHNDRGNFERAKVCFDSNGTFCNEKKDNFNGSQSTLVYNFKTDNEIGYSDFIEDSDNDWLGKCFYGKDGKLEYSLFFDENDFILKYSNNTKVEETKSCTGVACDYIKIDNNFLKQAINWYKVGHCPQNLVIVKSHDAIGNIFNTFCIGDQCPAGIATPVYQLLDGSYTKPYNGGSGGNKEPSDLCDLFGEDLIQTINSYLQYIKIIVPILIIAFGILDFGRAVLASNEDDIKKAQKRFIIRLGVGIAIFFIPNIINLLLELANKVWGNIDPNSCNIG